MPQIRHVPEDSNSIIPGRKVYFACHPEDHKLYFDEITAQLREISACTVFYYGPEENVALDEDYYGNLKDVNLMVIPVTTRLLCTPNRAMDVEVAYAVAQHIPVLPLMQEMKCSLNLEFLPRICIGNTFEELAEMTRDFPVENIGICLDVNHGMNRAESIPAMIRACGERLKTLHLSDYDNVDECHWNIGEGMLDWVEIQKSVAAMPQELLLIVESKVLAVPAWKGYTPDPRFEVQNVERNCMKFEFAAEQQELMKKIRAAGFIGGRC
jgi:hypothetical protein